MKPTTPLFVAAAIVLALAPYPAFAAAGGQEASSSTVMPKAGKLLYSADKHLIGPIYRVGDNGTVQLLVEGKIYSVSSASLTAQDGKIVTSVTKADLFSAR